MDSGQPPQLYHERRVFARKGDALVIYVCFERLSDNMFAVCQAEFIRDGNDFEKALREISARTIDLMMDEDRFSPGDFLPSLEAAIAAHNREFGTFEGWTGNAAH